MLETIICYLIQKLFETNYFEELYPLAQFAPKGDGQKPVFYQSNGQAKDITIYDHHNGMGYFRLLSSVTTEPGETDGGVPCKDEVEKKHPLRLVIGVPKAKLSKDDAFSQDRIATAIEAVLIEKAGPLKNSLQANSVTITVKETNTNARDILTSEYPGGEFKDINLKYALIAIDFDVTVKIYTHCIKAECDLDPTSIICINMAKLCDLINNCETIQQLQEELQNIQTAGLTELTLVSGAINSSNTIFEWSDEPTLVFVQSGKLNKNASSNGYTLSGTGNVITTLTEAPSTGDKLTAYK